MRAIAVFTMGALLALPASAGPLELKLFGTEMGEEAQYVCFVRHYDEAHLKSHPQQNVTDMALLVNGLPDGDGSAYFGLGIGVKFRGVENELALGGGCGTNDNGEQLNCGIDCDGGVIDVTLRDENSVRVEIPYGARTFDPGSEEEPDPAAEFGEDDKVFRLDRVSLKECLSLIWDEEVKAKVAASE